MTDEVVKILPRVVAYLQREADRNGMIEKLTLSEYANAVDCAFTMLTDNAPLRPRVRGRVERYWVCDECGAEIGKGDAFCRMCGREADWDDG